MDNFYKNCPIWLKLGMQVSYHPCPPLLPIITAPAHRYCPCPPIPSRTPILFRFFETGVSLSLKTMRPPPVASKLLLPFLKPL